MKTKVLLALLVLLPAIGFSQKYKLISGSYAALKGETNFNVEMDYSAMTFYKEKMSEEKYIAKRVKEITADKGKAEADKWLADWEKTKADQIPNKFLATANKHNGKGHKYELNADTKYTLIVKVIWIYPGWYGGVMKEASKLNTILTFVETANPSNVVLSVSSTGAIGDIYPVGIPNTNDRIAEAFGMNGGTFVKLLKKSVK